MPQKPPEFKTLKRVIHRLERGKIPYMLTGSMALNFYGQPRATNDFDIVIEILPAATNRFFESFKHDFYISREAIEEGVASGRPFNVIDNETVFKIDFIVRKKDPYSLEQFRRRQKKRLMGMEICVISPEDLILAKLIWSRESLSELQERDIKNLMTLLAKELDYRYLERWAVSLAQLDRLRSFYVPT